MRIMSLYEGTTGIQSLALLGRQISMNHARSLNTGTGSDGCYCVSQHFNNLQHYSD
jgi:hypothetical protein